MTKQKTQILKIATIFVVMAALYYGVAFKTSSKDFFIFISEYFLLFTFFVLLVKIETNFKRLLAFAFFFRLIFVFAVPELSPDFYRFIWDGELLTMGINPYAYVPNDLISQPGFYDSSYMQMLYKGTTELSQSHYTNYPVLNQFLFLIPTYFFDSIQANVISLKIIVLVADFTAIYFLKKILDHLKLPIQKLWLYALNPFIIIEFVGNLHFEGVMIAFLLGAIYFVMKKNRLTGGLFMAYSIQIKLIPLMLLPFFFKQLKWRKSIGFLAIVLLLVLVIGQFLWSDPNYFNNMMASVKIYFVKFQFNSSLFGIVNYFNSQSVGWNTTETIGPLLSKIATVLILLLAIVRNYKTPLDTIKGMLFALVIYYLFATTVHPWYISMILVLSIFTNYKFGLIWTLLVPLTYSFYVFESSIYLRYLEYLIVLSVLVYEIIKYTDKSIFNLNFKDFFS